MPCSNLKIIQRKSDLYFNAHSIGEHSNTLSVRARMLLSVNNPSARYSQSVAVVPCGKCMDCLRRRQTDLAVRCEREAVRRGSMHFVTLTYRQEDLPFAYRVSVIDYESGEVIERSPFRLGVRSGEDTDISSELHQSVLDEFRSRTPGEKALYINRVVFESIPGREYLGVIAEYTPSLNRRDVRLWLKSCRVQYKREFGESLPAFSYVLTGELGPRTCRPHYHICFFGLNDKIVQWFVSRWKYGTENNWKRVMARNEDGSSGFNRASRYVAKYVTKGKFEADSVKCEDCEKPRLCISKGLGNIVDDALISYYRCYDLYGRYNPDTLVLEGSSRKRLSDSQLEGLFAEFRKRSKISVDSVDSSIDLPLPKSLIRKIWFTYDKEKKSYRSYTIRALFASAYASKYLSVRDKQFRQFVNSKFNISLSEACSQFTTFVQNSKLAEEQALQQDFLGFYSKSLF